MDTSRFGRQLSSHKGTIAAGALGWYIGAFLLLGAISGVTKGQFGAAAGALGLAAVAFGFAVPLLRQSVDVFERGLVWTRVWGTVAVSAEEAGRVTLVRHYRRWGNYTEVRIALKGGGKRSILGVTEPEQLANYVSAWGRALAAPPMPAATGWVPPVQGAR
jgi:hypothetical protein